MVLPIELINLAKAFGAHTPLYLVGGAVRNRIMGINYNDYDVCSAASAEEVKEFISKTDCEIVCEFARTGTIVIKSGNYNFEYTRFRKDSYALGKGSHSPDNVEFTSDIRVDAERRDFTCNAVYYNIAEDKIIDPLNGVKDIKNALIRTTRRADTVLCEDALRIMRMVRLAMELRMDIDDECLNSAVKFAERLKDISAERVRDEFNKILAADAKYDGLSAKYKPSDGVKKLVEIGAMRFIMPEVLDMIGCAQNPKYHINDVYLHTLSAIDYCPPHLRLLALLHDIAKPRLKALHGNTYGHEILGEEMTVNIMKRLKYSTAEMQRTAHLVGIHMFNVDNKTRSSKCRRFIAANIEYVDDYLAFRYADGMATNSSNYDDSSVRRIFAIKKEMLDINIPMRIGDLPISGGDLIELGYVGVEIGKKLKEIWLKALDDNKAPTRAEILKKLSKTAVD